jgi:glycosyltransferase involved in cell wall biosynthesis
MSLGKAVVVTDYSSTTEFCNKNNALLVPYKIVDVKDWQVDVDAYKSVERWAEPDIDTAAAALRKLYDDKELREKIGLQAQKFIKEYFSVENFRASIEKFLDER